MVPLSRRAFLRTAITGLPLAVVGCREHVVEVERLVEREVTKVVRETVIVAGTPAIVEHTVEKLVTPTPSPKERATVMADVTRQSWSRFAMLMSPSFEEMFPDIRITWRSVSDWEQYPQVVSAAQASGQLADLLEAPIGPLLAAWAGRNTIRALDDLIAADGFDTSGFLQGPLAACRYREGIVGMPFIGHAGDDIVVYDQDYLAEAGILLPGADWTLDDLHAAAAAITAANRVNGRIIRFGYGEPLTLPEAYPLLHTFDAHLFSEDGQTCSLGDERSLAALHWIDDQIHSGNASPAPAQIQGGLLSMFGAGTLAMLRLNLHTLGKLIQRLPADRHIACTTLPRHPDMGKAGALASGMAYCLGGTSVVPEETFQWIKFACGREMGVQMYLGGYGEPGTRMASWTDARVLRVQPICAQVAQAADTAEAEQLPDGLDMAPCYAAWQRGVEALRAGFTTPEQAAESLCTEIDAALLSRPMSLRGTKWGLHTLPMTEQ
ncbi:MAG: extracellular solute-binding protein [Anaerolineae bacterium]